MGLAEFSCLQHICQLSVTEVLKIGSRYFSPNNNSVTCGHTRNILSHEHKNKIKIMIKNGRLILGCTMMTKDPVYQLWQLEESSAPGTPAERKPLNDAKKRRSKSYYSDI